MQLKVSITG